MRQREVTVQGQAIARLQPDRFDPRQGLGVQLSAAGHQKACLARLAVVQVQLTRVTVAVHRHHDLLSVAGGAAEIDHLPREGGSERRVEFRIRVAVIDLRNLRRAGLGDRGDHGLAIGGVDQARDLRHRVLMQHLERAAVRVEHAECLGRLAVAAIGVDATRWRRTDNAEFETIAVVAELGPLAVRATLPQLAARVVVALLVRGIEAQREARFLGGVQRQ